MKRSRFRLLVSVCLVALTVLGVQNILLLATTSEISDDTASDGNSEKIVPTFQSPWLPKKRDFHDNRKPLQHSLSPPATVAYRKSTTALAYRNSNTTPTKTGSHGNTTGVSTATTASVNSENSPRKSVADQFDDIRSRIARKNLEKKATEKPQPTRRDYDHWEDVWKSDNDFEYPFYSDDSRSELPHVPTNISVFFPTDYSNTTHLFAPPRPWVFVFKRFGGVFTDRNIDIFRLLSRWGELSLPFYGDVPRLKVDVGDPPVPRVCKLTPGPHIMKRYKSHRWRKHAECFEKLRNLTPFELEGNHILFTVRTSAEYHSKRLPPLFHTWLANVNRSNVVIVTDSEDSVLHYRAAEAGLKYRVSVQGYDKLCEKAGDEISLMFLPENAHYEWFCHVDDDVYVNLDRLVDVLANFKQDEPVYFGRAGTKPGEPRRVPADAKLGKPGTPYHFAVGGMYCLSRTLLNKARCWIGGREAFGRMCEMTNEPEDVTIGFVTGVVLGLELNQTGLIHSHGNDLYGVNPALLKYQIGISYGFGSVQWGFKPHNVVVVPQRLFSIEEDASQFLSLHCHYHKTIGWCLNRSGMLRRKHKLPPSP